VLPADGAERRGYSNLACGWRLWTKHYSAACGLLGPCACGEPGSDKRAAYLESMRALAKDIALHGLLSKLQDGQICPAQIAQIRERLGRIWPSPYVGQWVIRYTCTALP